MTRYTVTQLISPIYIILKVCFVQITHAQYKDNIKTCKTTICRYIIPSLLHKVNFVGGMNQTAWSDEVANRHIIIIKKCSLA